MKEIIERILHEEQLARDRILAARKEAGDLLQKAKKEADSMISKADADLAMTIEQKRQAALDECAALKDSQITHIRADVSRQNEARQKDIPGLVDRIFNRITASS